VFRTSLGKVREEIQGMTEPPCHPEVLNLVQGLLELNSNSMGMIPDTYRADAIDYIIGLRDVLSW